MGLSGDMDPKLREAEGEPVDAIAFARGLVDRNFTPYIDLRLHE